MIKRSNDKPLQRYDAKTHLAEIIYNKAIGKDCFRMGLQVRPSLGVIIPGQFIHLKLTPNFEPLLRRPFSIFNVFKTGENEPSVIEIAYQVVGKGTRLMIQMKPGTKIDLLGPLGNGFLINKKANISLLVGGGLGTAALHLLLKSLIESTSTKDKCGAKREAAAPPKRDKLRPACPDECRELFRGSPDHCRDKIYNLIGARSKEELHLVDSFRQLDPDIMIATEDGSKGTKGLVTGLLTKLIHKLDIRHSSLDIQIYACGPNGMIKAISHIAAVNKIPCQVSLEQWMGCGIGICRACVCRIKHGKSFRYATTCSEGPVFEVSQLYLENS